MPAFPDTTLLTDGQVIASCRVVGFLGKGGMGEVYLAEDLKLERKVAVKVLPRGALDPVHVERFLKEARMAAKIEHPNVMAIHDVGRQGQLHYIVMQYVEGKNLSEIVEVQGGPLPWKHALKLMRPVVKGVAAMHRHGMIHRDIKPSNIMVAIRDGRVFVMDFGLAREEAKSDMTPAGAIMGTPAFMSPEQCKGGTLDKRSDLFSLGVTLYYLLTARLPYEGTVPQVLAQIQIGKAPRRVHEVNPFVPRGVSDLVAKAMAHDLRQRYADADTLARAIGEQLHAGDVLPATSSLDTPDSAAGMVETGLVPELAPLESIPEGLPLQERLRPIAPWLVAGFAMAGAAVLLFVLPKYRDRPASGIAQANLTAPTTKLTADRTGMVWIPPGMVQMGNSEALLRQHAQGLNKLKDNPQQVEEFVKLVMQEPRTKANLPGFWMDRYEVTNAEYAKFVQETNHSPPGGWNGKAPPAGIESTPVTQISHDDALAYAAWARKKLPTNEQWVRAFRDDSERLFPWGDQWEPQRANVIENKAFPRASPVKDTPEDVSSFGVYNLVGNVDELMRDLVMRNGSKWVMVRGSHWNAQGGVYGIASFPTYYTPQAVANPQTGFRCVSEDP